MTRFLNAAALCVLSACVANGATIFSEDFESYADTAALGGVWSLGDGTLDTMAGNPGQSLNHPGTAGSFTGGNTNSYSFAQVQPGAGEKLIFSADIYDDGTSSNKRTTAGLRLAAGANIIEMGMYNSADHYSYRSILFGSGDPSWVSFSGMVDDAGQPMDNLPVAGWHTFTAEIYPFSIEFSLDLNGDGNINGTATVPVAGGTDGFDIIRLGGPSDLSSAGGGVNFDNISLTMVPEPATASLLGLSLLSLVGVRRRG